MRCRRRAPGTTGLPIILPHRAIVAGHTPQQGTDDWPICEATIINKHGDHPIVSRINDTHGMMTNMAGHLGLIRYGVSVVVEYPTGPVWHDIQDFMRCYEIL